MLAAIVSCSTQKNTASRRWWHSFHARYNTYYNGAQAYIDGSLEKETGNKDNFTEMIPLYTVSNKASREIGKGNFDRAIEKSQKAIKLHSIKKKPEWHKSRKKTEKDLEWLNRREYNPFLWKAWMLMGRSQFHQGKFDEAASTFAYMARMYSTQPAIYGRARAWLAKCYVEQDWIYDAEDIINKIRRDSVHWRAQKEWDYTYADYYLHTKRYEEAIPYLRNVIRHEMRRKQKAREWYLMGQIQASLGHKQEAYKAFRHVIRMNPPYELEFNARIAMTEVMAEGQSKKMIGKLRRMARSDNNKDYLDQVYYAIGNIYLAEKDTANAIMAYEKGNEKATRSGIEKGVLLLHLGELYWQQEKYSDARRCYGEAIGLLDKDRDDYKQLSERSKVLDELVPYTDAVHLQDSLQELARMSETDRNAAIDRVIEALKKKEKEELRKQQEAEAEQQLAQQGANTGQQNNQTNTATTGTQKDGTWYFYNPIAVSQGKQTFQKLWGKRENVDDWQRVNKTVVATLNPEELTDEQRDSIAAAEAVQDSLENVPDSAQNDPHKREYYLAQIPFTEEQVEASNTIIMDGLYNSGVIFKDKLDNLRLSEKQLRRITDQYPSYEMMDNVYYHLYLLYMRRGDKATADIYLNRLKSDFAESSWTLLLSDPLYEENARFGVHIEDSLYAATYDAFKGDRFHEVATNTEISQTRFPFGAHIDKFVFISGLSKLNAGDSEGCVKAMEEVVTKHPQSEVSSMAGMIINGVKAGRRLHGGKFDIGDVWSRRSVVLNDSDSIAARTFTAERNADFIFMIAYQPDSVDQNRLLFEMARHNFTSYLVRNFDMNIEDDNGLRRMTVAGFRSYDEVHQYARNVFNQQNLVQLLQKARIFIISTKNLELLGTQYSFDDYDKFYEEHFIPLKISTVRLLTEPAEVEYEKQPEPEATEEEEEGGITEDELYNGGVIETSTEIPADEEPTEVPAEEPEPQQEDVIVIDEPTEIVIEEPTTINVEEPIEIVVDDIETPTQQQQEDDIIIDEPAQKKPSLELEDEYYDLEGF
ncbi:MAG: tetratricopeptide repeat protein [Prevotella sp.]|nr:tetratricopeptide repeat protein [Prevotella sp.]